VALLLAVGACWRLVVAVGRWLRAEWDVGGRTAVHFVQLDDVLAGESTAGTDDHLVVLIFRVDRGLACSERRFVVVHHTTVVIGRPA